MTSVELGKVTIDGREYKTAEPVALETDDVVSMEGGPGGHAIIIERRVKWFRFLGFTAHRLQRRKVQLV